MENPTHSFFELGYDLNYQTSPAKFRVVSEFSVRDLFGKYGDLLWENGSHKYNVTFFIGELDELLLGRKFSVFGQDMLDFLIGKLRENGNSNATINRKLAALRKLLRKAYRMGDIHSLPEFRRQKERQGRIRYLDREEEDLLFGKIRALGEDYHALSVFLVDTARGWARRSGWPGPT